MSQNELVLSHSVPVMGDDGSVPADAAIISLPILAAHGLPIFGLKVKAK